MRARISFIIGLCVVALLSGVTQAQEPGVYAIKWNFDGTLYAVAQDMTVSLYTQNGQLLDTEFHHHFVEDVSWSKNNQLASGSLDGWIKIWNVVDNTLVLEYEFQALESGISGIAWSPDGSKIAAGGFDDFAVWNVTTRQHVNAPADANVWAMEWSPDSTKLALVSGMYHVEIFNFASDSSSRLYHFQEHTNYPISVSWSPDGHYVITSGYDNTVRRWNALTGTSDGILIQTDDLAWSVRYSPDGTLIAGALKDGTLHLWEAQHGTELDVIHTTAELYTVDWHPDGQSILYGGADNRVTRADLQQCDGQTRFKKLNGLAGFILENLFRCSPIYPIEQSIQQP